MIHYILSFFLSLFMVNATLAMEQEHVPSRKRSFADFQANQTTSTLHQAVIDNDYDKARDILDSMGDEEPLKKKHKGATPFFFACDDKKKSIAQLLLTFYEDIDLANELCYQSNGISLYPLQWAVINKQPTIVQLLLQNGADIHECKYDTLTPLDYAVRAGDENMINLLIGYGAQLPENKEFEESWNAFKIAKFHHFDKIKDLLVHLIDPETHETLLHKAVHEENIEDLKYLLEKKVDVLRTDIDGNTAFAIACAKNNTQAMDLLKESGSDIIEQNNDGDTPLHHAASLPCTQALEWLLKHNVEIDVQNINGNTPLMYAADQKNLANLQLLLKKGANTLLTNKMNQTALSIACITDAQCALELLKYPCDVNQTDQFGNTPIMGAIGLNSLNLVKELLQRGALMDSQIKDSHTTPLHLASIEHTHEDILSLLLSHNTAPELINKKDNREYTPLMIASRSINHTKLLCDHNADINALSKEGKSALWYACMIKNMDVINYLIGRDANVSVRNEQTSLLIDMVKENNFDIVKLLCEHGADIHAKDAHSKTALTWACTNNYKELIQLLLNNGANPNI